MRTLSVGLAAQDLSLAGAAIMVSLVWTPSQKTEDLRRVLGDDAYVHAQNIGVTVVATDDQSETEAMIAMADELAEVILAIETRRLENLDRVRNTQEYFHYDIPFMMALFVGGSPVRCVRTHGDEWYQRFGYHRDLFGVEGWGRDEGIEAPVPVLAL